jgi:peptidoglycan hydrolase CwlO-like protein
VQGQVEETRREVDRKDDEVKEREGQIRMLKDKLEEAQRNLESNANMITWLNK